MRILLIEHGYALDFPRDGIDAAQAGPGSSSGLGVPFLAAACFMSPFLRRMLGLKRAGRILRILPALGRRG